MLTHEEMVKRMLEEPAVKAEYDAQAEEYALLDELLRAASEPASPRRKSRRGWAPSRPRWPDWRQAEGAGGIRRRSPRFAGTRRRSGVGWRFGCDPREGCRPTPDLAPRRTKAER